MPDSCTTCTTTPAAHRCSRCKLEMSCSAAPLAPFVPPPGIDDEVRRIRALLDESRTLQPQALPAKFAAYVPPPGLAFTPADARADMQALLSMCRTLFMWTVAHTPAGELGALAMALGQTFPYWARRPRANARDAVAAPDRCGADVYAGLFRSTLLQILADQFGREEEADVWYLFAESAVMVWDE